MVEDYRQVFVVILQQCEITLKAERYKLNADGDFIFLALDQDAEEICVATVPKAHCQGIFNKEVLVEDDEDEFPQPFNEDEADDKEL